MTYYWRLADKYTDSKPLVEAYRARFGMPPSADGECAYVATKAVFQAMNKVGSVDNVPALIKELETMELSTFKGKGRFRPCDHAREQSVVIVKGKGAKASGWDVAEVVAEIPYSETLESCENNKADVPYGGVKLPGK